MKREDANKIKCDQCKVVVGLYQYAPGEWRCPECIWKEKELLENFLHQIAQLILKWHKILTKGEKL